MREEMRKMEKELCSLKTTNQQLHQQKQQWSVLTVPSACATSLPPPLPLLPPPSPPPSSLPSCRREVAVQVNVVLEENRKLLSQQEVQQRYITDLQREHSTRGGWMWEGGRVWGYEGVGGYPYAGSSATQMREEVRGLGRERRCLQEELQQVRESHSQLVAQVEELVGVAEGGVCTGKHHQQDVARWAPH